MSNRVVITRSAEKELNKIPDKFAVRIEDAMEQLGNNPRPPQAKKLQGSPFYRLRVGDYRLYPESFKYTLSSPRNRNKMPSSPIHFGDQAEVFKRGSNYCSAKLDSHLRGNDTLKTLKTKR